MSRASDERCRGVGRPRVRRLLLGLACTKYSAARNALKRHCALRSKFGVVQLRRVGLCRRLLAPLLPCRFALCFSCPDIGRRRRHVVGLDKGRGQRAARLHRSCPAMRPRVELTQFLGLGCDRSENLLRAKFVPGLLMKCFLNPWSLQAFPLSSPSQLAVSKQSAD